MKSIPPGGVVGILGGGQLGRMLSLSAARLGMDVKIFAPETDTPAERVSASAVQAEYDDISALKAFAAQCGVVTFEFENIPAASVEALEAEGVSVFPSSRALAMSQDRLTEKSFLQSIGVEPAAFAQIDGPADILPALKALGGKGVLKARRSGYDGKGQARVDLAADPDEAWAKVGGVPSVLEAFVEFEREISVVIARDQAGALAIYDTPENDHSGGILKSSTVPANVSDEIQDNAKRLAAQLANELSYVGVLALELFVMPDGTLFANEFAPRVHNTGHWTEEACFTSQFEQHMRAVCGWPLGPVGRLCDVRMDNLLGDNEIATWKQLATEGAAPRIYGKRGGGEGRKLGHVTRVIKP